MNCRNEIKFILPDFMALNRNKILMNIYAKYPELTMANSTIYSFYGTFPGCLWNGGRPDLLDLKYSKKQMLFIRNFYNKRGVKVTFTFTNSLLTKEHLEDEYCNQILEIFHNGMNEILVASDILEEYIRKKYPKYKINKSITVADGKPTYDITKYNLIVLDKHLNRNIGYLKILKHKEKIEILCDEVCYNDCIYTKEHYTEISSLQLGNLPTNELYGRCRYLNRVPSCKFLAHRDKYSKFYIKPNEIKKYADMGYMYFKLSGREKYSFKGIESIIDYLIKPEYQMDTRTYIVEQVMCELKDFSKLIILNNPNLGEVEANETR